MAPSDEDGKPSEPGRSFDARKTVWSILAVIFAVVLVLATLSMANYTEIAKAQVLAGIVTEDWADMAFDDAGELASVNMTINFTVVNPSQREIRVWILTYKSWVRDRPLETGEDTSRRNIDGTVTVNGTAERYYPVFTGSFSFDSPKVIVPPNSNLTVIKSITLNRTNFPDIMANFGSIFEHSENSGEELQWKLYSTAILFVHDIPKMPERYRNSVFIGLYEGFDITPGRGGAYP